MQESDDARIVFWFDDEDRFPKVVVEIAGD